jgi:hypothetical protein
MSEQQRQRGRPTAGLVHQVDHLTVDNRPRVCEPAQPRLERTDVEPLPVGQQTGQPGPRDTLLPSGAAARRQARHRQPPAQVLDDGGAALRMNRFHGY